jgi:hypothetical protein
LVTESLDPKECTCGKSGLSVEHKENKAQMKLLIPWEHISSAKYVNSSLESALVGGILLLLVSIIFLYIGGLWFLFTVIFVAGGIVLIIAGTRTEAVITLELDNARVYRILAEGMGAQAAESTKLVEGLYREIESRI